MLPLKYSLGLRIIAGKVSDGHTNESLAGAKVFVEGTDASCYTDANGRFSLFTSAQPAQVVKAELVGFETAVVKMESASADMCISLKPR